MTVPNGKSVEEVLLQYRASLYNNFEGNAESLDKAKAAIIKLFEQTVENAKPEYKRPEDAPVRSDMFEWMGYNKALKEYQQNLLQALSNENTKAKD